MNPPPARASTPTMNDAVARRSWFVAMNTPPTMQMTTPTAIRIMAVVRFDDCLLDPVAELMLPPRCFAPAGSPGRGRRGSFLTDARYYVLPTASSQVGHRHKICQNIGGSVTSRHEVPGRAGLYLPFASGTPRGTAFPRRSSLAPQLAEFAPRRGVERGVVPLGASSVQAAPRPSGSLAAHPLAGRDRRARRKSPTPHSPTVPGLAPSTRPPSRPATSS